MTSELSDPEDRVMVEEDEVREVREGWEELTEHEGLVTNLWASSSQSNPDMRLLSRQLTIDSSYSESLSPYLDMTFH